jgi:hypothetical protein
VLELAQSVRPRRAARQRLRYSARLPPVRAGMSGADGDGMANQNEGWTIPLHVIMWTTLSIGLIMTMVVFLMHC